MPKLFFNRSSHYLPLLLLAVSPFVSAQTAGFGAVAGTVTDPAAAVVPGASVTVHGTANGVDRTVQTNGSGLYAVPFLPSGNYEIQVSMPGFAKLERKGITMEVGRTLTLDFALTVQQGGEAVTVTGDAPVVDSEKTDVSQSVNQNLISNLPIIGRRWDNFVLLTPGVTTDGGLVSYRGISGLYNNNSVDGANNNQAFFSEARGRSTMPYVYSIDAIQEFQVSSSNYSAEFGQAAGGVVNAITKSGTNGLHGDLFYYYRNPSWNALDPINKSKAIYTQAIHQVHQFGGSVGGSAIKDKLFYFFNYDGNRRIFPVSYISTSTFPLPCPAVVSASQCAAANGYLNGLTGSYAREGVNDLAFGKIDYQVNTANRLSTSFNFGDYHAPNAYSSNSTYSNNSITANGPIITHTRFFIASLESTIKSNLQNSFRFQWGLDREIAGANSGGPNVSIAGVQAYGLPNALPRPSFPDEHRLQFFDTLSWTKGKHQIKAGVDVNVIHEVLENLFQGGGVYSYAGAPATAFANWVLDTYGVNNNDNLTRRHYSSFVQVTDPITGTGRDDFYNNDFAGFVEDTWRFRSNLTFNIGLRYELQTVPQPPKPNTSTPLNAYLTSFINTDKANFGPRLGVAWVPLKGLVVRAGYGMFYAKTTNSTYYTIRVENGVYQQTFNCSATSCPQLLFPNLIFTPPGPAPAAPFAGALTPQVTTFVPPANTQLSRGLTHDFHNPLVHEGDVTLEKQLPGNMSVSAAWLFSRGLHLPVFSDANIAPSTQTHTYAVLNASNALQQNVTVPWYTQRIDAGTGDILTGYSVVNSWYHGLALTFRRPMNHGIELLINYTYSKSIDDGGVAGANGTFNGTDPPLDPKNQKAENSLSDLDQRHRFVGSVVYAPTFFHGLHNKFAKQALDGFLFATIVTVASPQPLFTTISGFPSGGVDYGVTGGEVTNTGGSTGGRPPQYGRNVFFGRNLRNVDFRIMREFTAKERYRLQLIAEAFNLFNHTNISSVNGTAFNYTALGSGACTAAVAGGTNGCLIPNSAFLTPTSSTSTNGLYAARQLQISAKFVF